MAQPNQTTEPLTPQPRTSAVRGEPKRWCWYHTWWGVSFIIIGFLLIVALGYFSWRILQGIQFGLTESANSNTPYVGDKTTGITTDDPSYGKLEAEIQIVEFSDFQCPFCKEAYPIVRRVMTDYSDSIHFVYRDFPVTELHPEAEKAAEAGECAQDQNKFWVLHDKIFENQSALSIENLKQYALEAGLDTGQFNTCLDSGKYTDEVRQDLVDAVNLGVTEGTPTFIINGYIIPGVIPENTWRDILNGLLTQK